MFTQKNDPIEIPDDVMNKAQKLFKDTLACMLAGSCSDGIKPFLDTVMLWGGNKQATILGVSEQTSVHFAVMINSAMGDMPEILKTLMTKHLTTDALR